MELNEEVLRQAIKAIEAEPERWDQDSWVDGSRMAVEALPAKLVKALILIDDEISVVDTNVCGTTMCLAGHIVHQAGLYMVRGGEYVFDAEGSDLGNVETVAMNLLGIPKEECVFEVDCEHDELCDCPTECHCARCTFGVVFAGGMYELWELKDKITEVSGVSFDE